MSSETKTTASLKGGEWLIKESNAFETYTPEDFNEEQLMVKDMCLQFLSTEVLPIAGEIDKMKEGLMPGLMEKAGAQGLLGVSIPEDFGGMGKDFITSTLVNEGLGGGYSFSVAIASAYRHWYFAHFVLWYRCTKAKIHTQTGQRRMERRLWPY